METILEATERADGVRHRRRRRPPLPRALRRDVLRAAPELRKVHRKLFRSDPSLKHKVSRYLAGLLPPTRMRRMAGRPHLDDITEALRLEAAGVSRKEIYRQLGKRTAPEQHALREAMRQRKWRRRAKA